MFQFLEHKRTANLMGVVNALGTIALIVVTVWGTLHLSRPAHLASATQPHLAVQGHEWIVALLVALIVLSIVINVSNWGYSYIRRKRDSQREVIRTLSALQESHILSPCYVTALEHSTRSKEGSLSAGGTAHILTNSLKYDMFYSAHIAKNIIKGAKYIYIIPNRDSLLRELQDYISILFESLQQELQHTGGGVVDALNRLCSEYLEFWFFDKENPCLYNFAIFRQIAKDGLEPYQQYWWYINPSDKRPDSPMLTCEIEAPRDKSDLDSVFRTLKCSQHTGQNVYDHRRNLIEWIGQQG